MTILWKATEQNFHVVLFGFVIKCGYIRSLFGSNHFACVACCYVARNQSINDVQHFFVAGQPAFTGLNGTVRHLPDKCTRAKSAHAQLPSGLWR